MKKIILDLCGGTGSWSRPYKETGYDVRLITLPDNDVRTYIPPKNVYGILAAPPCTMFSLARTRAKKERDLREGMETVRACLNIIWGYFNNPKKLKTPVNVPIGLHRNSANYPRCPTKRAITPQGFAKAFYRTNR